jgi:hypothetical protein
VKPSGTGQGKCSYYSFCLKEERKKNKDKTGMLFKVLLLQQLMHHEVMK